MFHYVNAITNTKGDALIGYYVKLRDSAGAEVALFADESSTAIETVSGLANAAKVDSNGNASFYVADGEYTIDIYATDGSTFVDTYPDIPMAKIGMLKADSISDLANLDTSYPAILTLSGSQGIFIFDSNDLSVEVAADPEQNNYVAPSSDDTGTSGAWVRSNMSTTVVPEDTPQSGIISGLSVIYDGNLDFSITAGSYYLDGILHTAAAQSVTLDAADPTDPRIDVLYLDDQGVLDVLTGTPAVNPSKPSVDPISQLELTFAIVEAGATEISGTSTENIYLENTEWTTTAAVGVTVDSTSNPYAGTKCVETTTSFGTSSYVNFADSGNSAWGGDGNLIFRIRSKAAWHAKRGLHIQFWCDGAAVGNAVSLRDGTFGFSSANITTYQMIAIPKSQFDIAPAIEIDALRISGFGTGSPPPTFYLDNVQLQTNGASLGGDLTQAAADARYLKLTGGELSGDLIVPDEAYGVGWNASREVPTKNAVYDAVSSISGGGLGALLAANNLSDVANASTSRTNLGLGSIATLAETTTAQYRSNTADKALSTDQVWGAADYVALTDAATVAVDLSAGINFSLTIGGNRTLGAPSNTKNGQTGCIVITQDGTGSRTLAYHANWKFAGGTDPTLSTAAGSVDVLFYQVIGSTSIYANLVKAIA